MSEQLSIHRVRAYFWVFLQHQPLETVFAPRIYTTPATCLYKWVTTWLCTMLAKAVNCYACQSSQLFTCADTLSISLLNQWWINVGGNQHMQSRTIKSRWQATKIAANFITVLNPCVKAGPHIPHWVCDVMKLTSKHVHHCYHKDTSWAKIQCEFKTSKYPQHEWRENQQCTFYNETLPTVFSSSGDFGTCFTWFMFFRANQPSDSRYLARPASHLSASRPGQANRAHACGPDTKSRSHHLWVI